MPPDFPLGPRRTTFPARVVAGSTVDVSEPAAEPLDARAATAPRARPRAPFGRPRFAVIPVAGSISNLPPNMDPRQYPEPAAELASLRELAGTLADAGVDLIALEMMQDIPHGSLAMQAALETGLPVWLGVSCRRAAGGSGLESFDYPGLDFATALDGLIPMGPEVVNVMHCTVESVLPAIRLIRERWAGPIGVYPEIGWFEAPQWHFDDDETPERFAAQALEWVQHGARLVGGCCGTSPEHIQALAAALGRPAA